MKSILLSFASGLIGAIFVGFLAPCFYRSRKRKALLTSIQSTLRSYLTAIDKELGDVIALDSEESREELLRKIRARDPGTLTKAKSYKISESYLDPFKTYLDHIDLFCPDLITNITDLHTDILLFIEKINLLVSQIEFLYTKKPDEIEESIGILEDNIIDLIETIEHIKCKLKTTISTAHLERKGKIRLKISSFIQKITQKI